MFIVRYRKVWFALSALMLLVSAWGIYSYGFKTSIDFRGGTLTEVGYPAGRPDKAALEEELMEIGLSGFSVRPSGEENFIIRTHELTETDKIALGEALTLRGSYEPTIERSTTIGPVAGAALKEKALKGIAVVVLMIVLFITFAFRRVSKPVASWKYGLATVIALIHDVIIPTGVFVFLGHYMGVEIDLLFVTGLLAILGYSVHDSIVVFDRVRENLKINRDSGRNEDFELTVGKSVTQTLGRSINTSVTILITLTALYLFGSTATRDFSLLLIIGLIAGTYSSIFVGSPLLVTFQKWQKKSS